MAKPKRMEMDLCLQDLEMKAEGDYKGAEEILLKMKHSAY